MFWDGCQTFCIGLVAKWSAFKPPFLNALYEKKVKLWFENNGDEKGWSLLIIFTVNSHPSVQKKILSFLNLDGNLYGFLLFFFRVLRPPGGMSSNIFSDSDSASVTSSNESRASSTSPKTPQKQYKMASNFELGDEQPENPSPRRKPFKPSGNSCFDHRWRFFAPHNNNKLQWILWLENWSVVLEWLFRKKNLYDPPLGFLLAATLPLCGKTKDEKTEKKIHLLLFDIFFFFTSFHDLYNTK